MALTIRIENQDVQIIPLCEIAEPLRRKITRGLKKLFGFAVRPEDFQEIWSQKHSVDGVPQIYVARNVCGSGYWDVSIYEKKPGSSKYTFLMIKGEFKLENEVFDIMHQGDPQKNPECIRDACHYSQVFKPK